MQNREKFKGNFCTDIFLLLKNMKHDATGCKILNNQTTKFIEITKGSVEKNQI